MSIAVTLGNEATAAGWSGTASDGATNSGDVGVGRAVEGAR